MSFSSLEKFFDMTDKDPMHSNNLLSDAPSAKSRAMICSISIKYENLCDDSDPSLLSLVQYIVSDTFSAWSWSIKRNRRILSAYTFYYFII